MERTPPHNKDVEQQVLGALLLDNDAISDVASIIKPSTFYGTGHQLIYRAIIELGEHADFMTVGNRLNEQGRLEQCGDNYYLSTLVNDVTSSANVKSYCRILQDLKNRRDIITAAQEAALAAYDRSKTTEELQEYTERLSKLDISGVSDSGEGIISLTEDSPLIDRVRDLYKNGIEPGIDTGLPESASSWMLRLGFFTVIAGIPGHGKSEVLDAVHTYQAMHNGWHWAVASFENYPLELHISKCLEKMCKARFDKRRERHMSEEQMEWALREMINRYHFIEPVSSELSPANVINKIVRCIKIDPLVRGFIIDPWNEMDHTMEPWMNLAQYLARQLSLVRTTCRQHLVHGCVVAHPKNLNKNKDGKFDCPTPYDLDGGAMWRNKADNIVAPYRPSFHDPRVQLHVLKIRNNGIDGMAGSIVDMIYNMQTGCYEPADINERLEQRAYGGNDD